MGVTGLWTILAPVKEHKELSGLQGETLAVDLSMWVCENQSVRKMHGIVTRPYLRNLFFRVSHLTQLGVKLVFVVDGKAPELKWQEMSRRNQVMGRGRGSHTQKGSRSNFNRIIKECCELLDILGIPHVQSEGEAEAMCAALNASGLVDACITDDGDAFLYGARKVYRNFTMNSKDPHVESYSMTFIETELGLTRQALVGAALLLGCDYLPGGVHGVGLERVVKLMSTLGHMDVLKRFESWASMNPAECINKVEQTVRQKALAAQGFPQKQVISEFLNSRETTPSRQFSWRRPVIQRAQSFAETKLEWPTNYTLEKVLPLVTLWDMTHISQSHITHVTHLQPHRIVKTRLRHGVSVYEVEWHKEDGDTSYPKNYYTTLEEQFLFAQCFPNIVEQFNTDVMEVKRIKKQGSKKKTKPSEHSDVDELISQVESINLNLPAKSSVDDKNIHKRSAKAENQTVTTKSEMKTKTKTTKKCSNYGTKLGVDSCYKVNQMTSNHTQSTVLKNSCDTSLKDQTETQYIILLDSDEESEIDSEDTDSDGKDGEMEEELFLTLTQRILLKASKNNESESLVSNSCSQLSSTSVSKSRRNNESESLVSNSCSQLSSTSVSKSRRNNESESLVSNSCSQLLSTSLSSTSSYRQGGELTVSRSCSALHSGSCTNVHSCKQGNESTISSSCSQLPSESVAANSHTSKPNRTKSDPPKLHCHSDGENVRKNNSAVNIHGIKNKLRLNKNGNFITKSSLQSSTEESGDKMDCFEGTLVSESDNGFVSATHNSSKNLTPAHLTTAGTKSCQERGSALPEHRSPRKIQTSAGVDNAANMFIENQLPVSHSDKTTDAPYSPVNGQSFELNNLQRDLSFVESVSDCSPLSSDHVSRNSFLEFGNFNMQTSLLTDLSLMTSPCPGSRDGFSAGDEHQPASVQSPSLFDSPDISFRQMNLLNPVHIPFRINDQGISMKCKIFMTENSYEDLESMKEKMKDEQTEVTNNFNFSMKVLKNQTVTKTNNVSDYSHEEEIVKCNSIAETYSEELDDEQNVYNVGQGNAQNLNLNPILINSLQDTYSTCTQSPKKLDYLIGGDDHHSNLCLQVNVLESKLDDIRLDESQKENFNPSVQTRDRLITESGSPFNMSCVGKGRKMENSFFDAMIKESGSPSDKFVPDNLSSPVATEGGNSVARSCFSRDFETKNDLSVFCLSNASLLQENSPAPLSLADRLRVRLTGRDQIALENLSQK